MANSRETIETTQNEAAPGSCRSGKQTQETKCLELPETRHTAAVVEEVEDIVVVVVADDEAPGGKTPNNRKSVLIYHLLASGVGPWSIPKELFPLTDMMHQNSSRRF